MILKLKNVNNHRDDEINEGWTVFDNLTKVNYKIEQIGSKSYKQYIMDRMDGDVCVISQYFQSLEDGGDQSHVRFATINAIDIKTNEEICIYTDNQAYLCNDNGDTLEVILR